LLAGLSDAELDALNARMRPRRFAAGEELCRAGAPSDSTWLITGGLVHWFVPTTEGANDLLLRLRKGDVIGAQDAVSGEPRSATVIASIPTSTLELGAEDLIDLARRFPQILVNLIRTQRERLFRVNARKAETARGEEIALVAGPSLEGTVGAIVAAARSASPRPVSFVDRRLSFAGALTAADDLAAENATVLIQGAFQAETLEVLLDQVDRVVALAGTAAEAEQLGELSAAAKGHRLEVVLVGDEAAAVGRSWCAESGIAPVRICARQEELALFDPDVCWLARHLTRTKLGIALGAGGAKGYAHVGVLQVLAEAGYVEKLDTSLTLQGEAASEASSPRTWRWGAGGATSAPPAHRCSISLPSSASRRHTAGWPSAPGASPSLSRSAVRSIG
jgi:CRP-like cAMP-binding protein